MATPPPCRRRWPLLAVTLFCSGLSMGVAGDPAEFPYRTTTSEVRRASHAVERLPAHARGLIPLFDTIGFAADFLAQHGDARAQKVLIVLSDGEDNLS